MMIAPGDLLHRRARPSASMGDLKKVGRRSAARRCLYFEIVSTFALAIGLNRRARIVQPGRRALQHRSGGRSTRRRFATYVTAGEGGGNRRAPVSRSFPTASSGAARARGDLLQVLLVCNPVGFSRFSRFGSARRGKNLRRDRRDGENLLRHHPHDRAGWRRSVPLGAMAFTVGAFGVGFRCGKLVEADPDVLRHKHHFSCSLGAGHHSRGSPGSRSFDFIAYIKDEIG